MGRKKKYQRGDVIEDAVMAFWEKGYSKTSLHDLEDATGLNKKSLYHEFGSKRELFDKVIDYYIDMKQAWTGQFLGTEPLGIQNIIAFFDAMQFEPNEKGCLISMTISEITLIDGAMHTKIAAMFDSLHGALVRNLEADLNDASTSKNLADFLITTIHGITTMAKLSPSAEKLEAVKAIVHETLQRAQRSTAQGTAGNDHD